MYAIGDRHWPGISKLVEEAGEVIQVCGKLMGTRGKVEHWDGTTLNERLEDELGDLLAAINFVITHCPRIDRTRVLKRAADKTVLFEGWHTKGDPTP